MARHLKLLNGDSQHPVGYYVDRVFWLLIALIIGYAAKQLEKLGASVDDLNQKMAVIVMQVGTHEKRLDVIESHANRR